MNEIMVAENVRTYGTEDSAKLDKSVTSEGY